MQAAEYQRLQSYESWYWWYAAHRENLVAAVRSLGLPRGARLLDAGCGTGRNLAELSERMSITPFGIDVSDHAAALWNGNRTLRRSRASVNQLPFADDAFDAVTCVDVLGCRGVNAPAALGEFLRVLHAGGRLVILVPAFQWLHSPHDRAVHSERRFTLRSLAALLEDAGFRVQRNAYCYATLFPMIAGVRGWRKLHDALVASAAQSDLAPLPGWLNRLLFCVARVDGRLCATIPAPFGTTVLAVAEKPAR
jgi:ubiquinone/menaquinone biosynthesis C-methylase UbiE